MCVLCSYQYNVLSSFLSMFFHLLKRTMDCVQHRDFGSAQICSICSRFAQAAAANVSKQASWNQMDLGHNWVLQDWIIGCFTTFIYHFYLLTNFLCFTVAQF